MSRGRGEEGGEGGRRRNQEWKNPHILGFFKSFFFPAGAAQRLDFLKQIVYFISHKFPCNIHFKQLKSSVSKQCFFSIKVGVFFRA